MLYANQKYDMYMVAREKRFQKVEYLERILIAQ